MFTLGSLFPSGKTISPEVGLRAVLCSPGREATMSVSHYPSNAVLLDLCDWRAPGGGGLLLLQPIAGFLGFLQQCPISGLLVRRIEIGNSLCHRADLCTWFKLKE